MDAAVIELKSPITAETPLARGFLFVRLPETGGPSSGQKRNPASGE